jgi:hypothetical protein
MSEEETTKISVKRKTINGQKYLISSTNVLYNPETREEVGLWDEESKTIKPLPDDDDEDDDDDDEDADENDGIYYLDKSSDYFNQYEEKRKPNRDVYYVPTFDTGIRLSNGIITQDIVTLDTGAVRFGIPVSVETNGITKYVSSGGSEDYNFVVEFINEDNEKVGRYVNRRNEIIGIYSPERGAFIALFDYDKRHTTLKTYDSRIVNAFREYILPKILFKKPEPLRNYKQKALKLPPLEKALEDAKKDLDAETDPMKQKVVRSLMKKIITSIPKAKEFDDAEKAKKDEYDFEDELIKQKNKQLVTEQNAIKKQRKDKEDEEKRVRLEARTKAREEATAKAAEEKRQLDERERLKAKRIQYKSLDEAKSNFKRIAYSYEYLVDDPEKPNVRRGRDVMRTSVSFENWIKVKEMLETLPVEDVDWYYELKADMERFLDANKENSLVDGIERFYEYKSQVEKPSRWISFDETKKGIAKRDAFVAKAFKDRYDLSVLLKKYFTNEEIRSATEIYKTKRGKGIDSCWKGYEAIGMKKKGKKLVPNCVPMKTGGKVVSLGQAADNISQYDEIYKFSNPKRVQELAKKYLGDGGIIYRSFKKDKKYMVYNPNDEKWVHFGALNYEDFTKHKDEKRRQNYLKRSANIKGDWKNDKYSPNNLARNLLW